MESGLLYNEMNKAQRLSFDHDELMHACGRPDYRKLTDRNALLIVTVRALLELHIAQHNNPVHAAARAALAKAGQSWKN